MLNLAFVLLSPTPPVWTDCTDLSQYITMVPHPGGLAPQAGGGHLLASSQPAHPAISQVILSSNQFSDWLPALSYSQSVDFVGEFLN